MLLSLDFGITITDILKKTENGNIEHKMLPSDQKPSINFIKEVFKDLDFSKDIEFIALILFINYLNLIRIFKFENLVR